MPEKQPPTSAAGSTGEEAGPQEQGSIDFGAQAADKTIEAAEKMAEFVHEFRKAASAEACVGPAQTVNGRVLVPLAAVSVSAGFGLGFGGGGGVDQARNQGGGGGGGSGGGGHGTSRVIAVAEISDAGVVVKPVPDVTRLGLAFLALVGVRMMRRGRRAAGPAERVAGGPLRRLLRRRGQP